MRIAILTLFPDLVAAPLRASMMRKAVELGAVEFAVIDIRAYASGRHQVTDDYPFGGGAGMVLKPEPVMEALEDELARTPEARVVLMDPKGRPFDQAMAREFARFEHLVLVAGHYEGIDERVRTLIDEPVSIGDYVLTGGELPALVVTDAVVRLLPGVLNPESVQEESFESGRLEGPQFTRPRLYRGQAVPEVLLSGHHAEIARWRRRQALRQTLRARPDLLHGRPLGEAERELLRELRQEVRRRRSEP